MKLAVIVARKLDGSVAFHRLGLRLSRYAYVKCLAARGLGWLFRILGWIERR